MLLAVILLLATTLAGCSGSAQEVLYVYNVGTYIDKTVNSQFEEEFNCKVIYETYDSNESMYYKLTGSNSTYDVIFPSDYMIERLISEDMLLPLDKANIPNLANLGEEFLNRDYDPDNTYSVPYFSGTLGIVYNKKNVNPAPDSWGVLWDEAYKGEILMYDSQRDSLGVALKYLGYSMNTKNASEIAEAEALLSQQKRSGLVLAYVTDYVIDMMIGEEAALAVMYSGDAVYVMSENPDLGYVVPKEGSNIWYDAMCIPKTAQNKTLAEAYINFMCRDDICLLNTEEVMYTTANKNITEDLRATDWANNDAYFTPTETAANCEQFHDPGEFVSVYADAWERAKAGQ